MIMVSSLVSYGQCLINFVNHEMDIHCFLLDKACIMNNEVMLTSAEFLENKSLHIEQ